MAFMNGKRGLIMGVANDHSIAWGIAKAVAAQGASLAFTYQGEALGRRRRRIRPLAADHHRRRPVAGLEDDRHLAARAVVVRLQEVQREAGGHGGVDGVAALAEDVEAGLGGERVAGGNHGARGHDGGAARLVGGGGDAHAGRAVAAGVGGEEGGQGQGQGQPAGGDPTPFSWPWYKDPDRAKSRAAFDAERAAEKPATDQAPKNE